MNSTGFWSTFIALSMSILPVRVFSRPICLGQDLIRTSKWTSDKVGDDQLVLRSDDTRRLTGRDHMTNVVANNGPARPSLMGSHDSALTDQPFVDDYARINDCRYCDDDFGEGLDEAIDNVKFFMVAVGVLAVSITLITMIFTLFRHMTKRSS